MCSGLCLGGYCAKFDSHWKQQIKKSGFAAAFFVGVLPPHMPASSLPFLLATYGLAEFIGALCLGRGADLFGKRNMMIVTMITHLIILVLSFFVFSWNSVPMYYVLYFLCGIADSGNITQIYARM